MLNQTKFAITWAELILVALLAAGGIGIWAYVAGQVDAEMKTREPVEAYVTNTKEVVTRQTNLNLVQTEFAALQEEIGKQRAALQGTNAQVEALRSAYPFLASLPNHDVFSPELFKTYWDAQLQSALIRRQLSELDAQIDALIEQKADRMLEWEQSTAGTKEYLLIQEEITYNDSLLVACKEKAAALKLDLAGQQALFTALEELHPGLAEFSLSRQTLLYPSSDILQKYLQALSQQNETREVIASLEPEITAKQTAFISAAAELTEAQKSAYEAYLTAQKDFLDQKKAEIRRKSSLWIAAYLVAAFLLYGIIALLRRSLPSFWTVLLLTSVVLLILVAYQEFQVMGAAVVSLVLFIVLLILIALSSRQLQKEASDE